MNSSALQHHTLASRRSAIISAACLVASLSATIPLHSKPPQRKPGEIQVQTNLVNVIASVQTADKRPVIDLTADKFTVIEDGVPQTIERFEAETDQPLDLVLMVDTSLSALKDLKIESDAAAQFIRQIVRPDDRLALYEFSDEVTQISSFSSSVHMLEESTRRLAVGAGTALYDAVYLGARSLERGAPDRRRVIVLVTDAGETTSHANFDTARQNAVASGALLYSIVIREMKSENGRNTAGEHALATITDDVGGAMYFPGDIGELSAMFDQINRELRTQYLLGYYPRPTPPPGMYRHIQLTVQGGDNYILHYRKEYLTAGTSR